MPLRSIATAFLAPSLITGTPCPFQPARVPDFPPLHGYQTSPHGNNPDQCRVSEVLQPSAWNWLCWASCYSIWSACPFTLKSDPFGRRITCSSYKVNRIKPRLFDLSYQLAPGYLSSSIVFHPGHRPFPTHLPPHRQWPCCSLRPNTSLRTPCNISSLTFTAQPGSTCFMKPHVLPAPGPLS